MTPRPATPTDWPSILALLTEAGLPTSDLAPGHVSHFLVVPEAGGVTGCVAVEPYGTWGLLRSLAVSPDSRERGLGSELVEAAVEHARLGRLTDLVLLTTTAEAFFRDRGWVPVAREGVPEAVRESSEFTGICPSSAACLALRVGEGHPAYPA